MNTKNISIADAFTHQIIFQRVYNWKATSAFSNLGKLIECFYQFARTVDDGYVVGIDFETPPKEFARKKRDDNLRSNRGDTMHMMTIKTPDITVSVFLDLHEQLLAPPEDRARFEIFLHSLKIAFETLFLPHLTELRARHHITSTTSPQELENISFDISAFDEFSLIADDLCEHVFGNVDSHTASLQRPFTTTSNSSNFSRQTSRNNHNNFYTTAASNDQLLEEAELVQASEKQLDHWQERQHPPVPPGHGLQLDTSIASARHRPAAVSSSLDEEVRKCLEAVNIHLGGEVVLDLAALSTES